MKGQPNIFSRAPTTLSSNAPGTYPSFLEEPLPLEVLRNLLLRKHSGIIIPQGPDAEADKAVSLGFMIQGHARAALLAGRVFEFGDLLNDPDDLECENQVVPFYEDPSAAYRDGVTKHPFSDPYIITYTTHEPCRDLCVISAVDEHVDLLSMFIAHDNGNGRLAIRLACTAELRRVNPNKSDDGPQIRMFHMGFSELSHEYDVMSRAIAWVVGYFCRALWVLQHPINRTVIGPTAEQAKLRRRLSRPPLPAYTVVSLPDNYITPVYEHRVAAGTADRGGTHASPVEHERQGHWVNRDNKRYWRRACTVNKGNPGPKRNSYEVRSLIRAGG